VINYDEERRRQSTWKRYVALQKSKSGGEKKAAKFYRLGRPRPQNLASAKFYFAKNKIWQLFGETDLAKKKKK
jgi:hypothetical protein